MSPLNLDPGTTMTIAWNTGTCLARIEAVSRARGKVKIRTYSARAKQWRKHARWVPLDQLFHLLTIVPGKGAARE